MTTENGRPGCCETGRNNITWSLSYLTQKDTEGLSEHWVLDIGGKWVNQPMRVAFCPWCGMPLPDPSTNQRQPTLLELVRALAAQCAKERAKATTPADTWAAAESSEPVPGTVLAGVGADPGKNYRVRVLEHGGRLRLEWKGVEP